MLRLLLAATLAVLLAAPSTPARAQGVVAFGGTEVDEGQAVARDAAGNVYVAGTFRLTTDFDPSDGPDATDTFTSPGHNTTFVVSYDAAGAFRWAFPLNSTVAVIYNVDVATDGARLYVGGALTGTVDFDPGPGTANRTSVGGADIFIAAYDAATGALVWVNVLGNATEQHARGVATAGGRVYATGTFRGEVDFDPGPGTASRRATTNSSNTWIAAYGATDGAFVWAGAFNGSAGNAPEGVAADGARVYVTGHVEGTIDLDPGPATQSRTSTGSRDIFIAAYDAATGAYAWGHTLGGTANTSETGYGVATDGTRLYATGNAGSTVDFDPGPATETRTGGSNFIAAYDAATGAFAWANLVGAGLQSNGVATDGVRVYGTGTFQGTQDFDPGPGTASRTSNGNLDAFVAAYAAADGTYVWANAFGAASEDRGRAVAVAGGRVTATGTFFQTVDFDPGPGTASRTSNGSLDAFVTTYEAATGAFAVGSVAAEDDPRALRLFGVAPNPSAGGAGRVRLVLDAPGRVTLTLHDVLGRRVAVLHAGEAGAGVPVEAALPAGLPPGVYLVRAATPAGVASRRVTVAR